MLQNIYHNLKWFSIEKFAFGCLGIDIESREEVRIVKRRAWLSLQFVVLALWCIMLSCYIRKYIVEDVDEAAEAIMMLTPCMVASSKLLPLIFRGRQFIRLIRELKDPTNLANSEERQIWITANQRSKLITFTYAAIMCATAGLHLIMPLIDAIIIYVRTGRVVLTPPFMASYPYDQSRPFGFILTYVLLVPYINLVCVGFIGVDCLFCWLIHNITARFRILRSKLNCVASDLSNGCDWLQFQRSLNKAILYHCRSLVLTHSCQLVLREIILGVFFFNCVQVCVFLYLLSNITEFGGLPQVLTAFITISTQLAIYGFGGEKLQSESEDVSSEIYLLFPWHLMSPAMRRQLLLPLMCAQRETILSGYLFVANREILLELVKMSASFSALLSAMKGQISADLQ